MIETEGSEDGPADPVRERRKKRRRERREKNFVSVVPDLPPGHEERIRAIAERVERETGEMARELERHVPERDAVKQFHKPGLPGDLSWLDLKVVNCRRCRRTLLSPSCERVRDRSRGLACLPWIPPPVVATVEEVAYLGTVPQRVTFFVCGACA